MLQNMRDKAQGWIVKVIIAFIVLTFAIFGLESLAPHRNSPEVAEVNGQVITEQQLMKAVEEQRPQQQLEDEVFDEDTSQRDQALKDQFRKKVLEVLIRKEVVRQYTDKIGMFLSEESVDQMIRSMPEFQIEGKFDAVHFQQLIRSIAMTPLQFRQRLRDDLLVSYHQASIAGSEFITPYGLQELNAIQEQTRDIAWLTLDVAKVKGGIEVKDDDIEAYYQNNQATLMSKEQVSLEYVILDRAGLLDQIDVSESEIIEAYQLELERLKREAANRFSASIILLELTAKRDEKAALALANELKVRSTGGDDFAALAREYSDDPNSAALGGDLGTILPGGFMGRKFDVALDSLAKGEVSQPLVTEFGVVLIKRTVGAEPKIPAMVDVRDDMIERVKSASFAEMFTDQYNRLAEISFESSDLQQPAEELGLTVQSTDLFDREGGEGIAGNSVVIQAAFNNDLLDLHINSEPLSIGKDTVAVIRIKEHKPAKVKPLSEVREMIVATLQEENAHQQLNDQANAILSALASGKSESDIAKKYAVSWQERLSARRVEQGVPAQLLQKAFKLPYPGNVPSYAKVFLPDGDVTIVAVKKIEKGKDIVDAMQIQNMSNALSMKMGGMVYSEYLQTLINNAEIERFTEEEES